MKKVLWYIFGSIGVFVYIILFGVARYIAHLIALEGGTPTIPQFFQFWGMMLMPIEVLFIYLALRFLSKKAKARWK